MTTATEMLESALALAGAGFQVFPLQFASKEPLKGSRGFKDATGNAAVLRRWFGSRVERNIGIRTGAVSRLWVLDVDDPAALAALEAGHGRLPLTRIVATSRGRHYWFRNGKTTVPNSASKVAPDIDVRGEGGYVLAPPSVHPTGVVYEWANDAPLVEAPAWLVERAVARPAITLSERATAYQRRPDSVDGPSRYGRAALEREIVLVTQAGEGGRNCQLNRSSFRLHQLVASGVLDAGEVERRLIEGAIANGLAADTKSGGMGQVMRTIRSGARAGLLHPRGPRTQGGRP
jgi:hypothetical protein